MPLHRPCVLILALAILPPAPAPAHFLADDAPKLAGTWKWSWKDAAGETHRHVLEIEGVGDKLTGRERFDDKAAIKVDDLKLVGKKISFSVTRDNRRAEYEGTVDSTDLITGNVTVVQGGQSSEFGWSASREKAKKGEPGGPDQPSDSASGPGT